MVQFSVFMRRACEPISGIDQVSAVQVLELDMGGGGGASMATMTPNTLKKHVFEEDSAGFREHLCSLESALTRKVEVQHKMKGLMKEFQDVSLRLCAAGRELAMCTRMCDTGDGSDGDPDASGQVDVSALGNTMDALMEAWESEQTKGLQGLQLDEVDPEGTPLPREKEKKEKKLSVFDKIASAFDSDKEKEGNAQELHRVYDLARLPPPRS